MGPEEKERVCLFSVFQLSSLWFPAVAPRYFLSLAFFLFSAESRAVTVVPLLFSVVLFQVVPESYTLFPEAISDRGNVKFYSFPCC